jgi:hypothetical protein
MMGHGLSTLFDSFLECTAASSITYSLEVHTKRPVAKFNAFLI